MFRLTLSLCAALYAALLIAGGEHGQLRPGLAKAVAEGRMTPDLVAVVEPEKPREPVMVLATAPVIKSAVPKPQMVAASYRPVADVAPPREVVQAVEEPVFTLSSLPTEAIPDAPVVAADTLPETTADGQIWYVTAESVNVREGPSTDTSVLGKLAAGEAALVVSNVDGEWARIVIQGDGMEGYVALRFLSPAAP